MKKKVITCIAFFFINICITVDYLADASGENGNELSKVNENAINLIQNGKLNYTDGNPVSNWDMYFGSYDFTDFEDTGGPSVTNHSVSYRYSKESLKVLYKTPLATIVEGFSNILLNVGTEGMSSVVAQKIDTIPGREYNVEIVYAREANNTALGKNELSFSILNGANIENKNEIISKFEYTSENIIRTKKLDFKAVGDQTTVLFSQRYRGAESIVQQNIHDVSLFEYGNNIKVNHINEDGRNIKKPEILTGYLNTGYSTQSADIKGYILKEQHGQLTGVFTREDQTVTFVYTIEGETNVLAELFYDINSPPSIPIPGPDEDILFPDVEGQFGPVGIRYVSDLNFGLINVKQKNQTIYLPFDRKILDGNAHNSVVIQDYSGNSNGWSLNIQLDMKNMRGSVLTFIPEWTNGTSINGEEFYISPVVHLNDDSQVLVHTNTLNIGINSFALSKGIVGNQKSGVSLEVPANVAGDITGEVLWTLTAGPI